MKPTIPTRLALSRAEVDQAARRRTSQMAAAMATADSTSSQPPSMGWKGQSRLAGWYDLQCV
jgi:hypothetical protein